MQNVYVDFSKETGKIKPMNAVNNGPVKPSEGVVGNFEAYKALKVPYARLHDCSFFAGYGGEYSVDVHRIFPDFHADENDPDSYIFGPTDAYLQSIIEVGTKIYYRLGASIEHGEKKGTYPPQDYAKWARICEHIILHYTKGWANGFHYDITYWEIWNEPDAVTFDKDGNFVKSSTWQGTYEQFYSFYATVAKYLKSKFPHLKIGGCGFCGVWEDVSYKFFQAFRADNVPLDFYAFHIYTDSPEKMVDMVLLADSFKKRYGFDNTELHLNEWNYVYNLQFTGEALERSKQIQRAMKGAAFSAACMIATQNSPLDMLMYYDARPSAWNGMFDMQTYQPFKTYYAFLAWAELAELKKSVWTKTCEDVYVAATSDGAQAAVLLAHYNDEERAEKEICLRLDGCNAETAELYLLDDTHNLQLVHTQSLTTSKEICLTMKNQTVYLIKLKTA